MEKVLSADGSSTHFKPVARLHQPSPHGAVPVALHGPKSSVTAPPAVISSLARSQSVSSVPTRHSPAAFHCRSNDQHSGGDQLVADMVGRPGVPRAGCDAGSLGEDVVATASDLPKLGDGVGEVVLIRCMPPSRTVQRAVEKLIFGGHDSLYRTSVRLRYIAGAQLTAGRSYRLDAAHTPSRLQPRPNG